MAGFDLCGVSRSTVSGLAVVGIAVSTLAVFGPTGYFNGSQRIDEDEALDAHLDCLRYDIGS